MIEVLVCDVGYDVYCSIGSIRIKDVNNVVEIIKEYGYEEGRTKYNYKRGFYCGNSNAFIIVVEK